MFIRNQILKFSPSDLITFMESPFDSWMDRHHAQYPGLILPDEGDSGKALLQKHGNAHEDLFLNGLIEQGKDVAIIKDSVDAQELTVQAMKEGREIIYQANLAVDRFAGKADFLYRVNQESALGAHSYQAWDTKLARKAKPYFIIQLCCYSEMIACVQGNLPELLKVVLGDLSVKEFRTTDYFHYYKQLKQSFLQFQESFDRDRPPECIPGTYSRWTEHAAAYLDGCDHLSRVANIRQGQIKRLTDCAIETLTALATMPEETKVPKLADETLQTLRCQARLQLQTAADQKTAFEMLPVRQGKGLTLLPPNSANDIFFDMEGYPYFDGGLEYLFGAAYEEKPGSMRFCDWWAHNRAQEKIAFEQFIDWIYVRWRQDPSMHIYHYANYEVAALRRLAGRHSTRVEQLDDLLREGKFVDLYQITRQSLQVGESSYSIKSIEHLFRSKRAGTVATAMDSVVFYDRWLEDADGSTWQESKLLREIRAYNEIDCLSTKQLADWLWHKQEELGIKYGGKIRASLPAPKQPSAAAQLALNLVEGAASLDQEGRQLQLLLAHLLEFHKREAKPVWWRMFDRQTMTVDELRDDLDCLADLRRTKRPPVSVRKSKGYEYSFDPDQDYKLVEGEECLIVDNLNQARLEILDRENGFALLVTSARKEAPPEQLSLMRNDYVASDTIEASILKVVSRWHESGQLSGALSALLRRQEPNIKGRLPAAPIVTSNQIDTIAKAIQRMDNTTLCIQGPPGSGKTYTASHAIVELLRNGKRVAIASNSHKAIDKLLVETAALAQSASVTTNGIKVGPTSDNADTYQQHGLAFAKGAKDLFERKSAVNYNLVGGTAWLFSHAGMEGLFDYIFVDEAGQVSLANIVGMSDCASNIVLIGDQMQLEQPIQGTHPGESGQSCLEYLLQGLSTVPPNVGIFLQTSWRMHPEICSVVSQAVYDNRLQAHPDNCRRTLRRQCDWPTSRFIPPDKDAGLVWLPVNHEGNVQSSVEEVDVIENLISDLLHCEIVNLDGGTRPLELKDILVVTPYNMQARLIKQRVAGVAVASVDKFQGQQAPVVILSMCASEGRSTARGLDFLFSKSRLNVAISRAQTMAFVVSSAQLLNVSCSSVPQMNLLNFFYQIVEKGQSTPDSANLRDWPLFNLPAADCRYFAVPSLILKA